MRVKYGWFLPLIFVLAGCFQQAGQPLDQPSGQTLPQATFTMSSPDTGNVTPLFPATSTLPPITVIAPTRQPLVLPSSTPEASAIPLDNLTPTTSSFITPSSPLGPVTDEPTTPLPILDATATPSGLITPTALPIVSDSTDGCTYTVQPGDNLFRIAVNHDITLDDLRAANPQIVGDLIQPNDVLNIPDCGSSAEGSTGSTDTGSGDTGVTAPAGGTTHTVQRGETLFAIARQYGVTVQAIVNANSMTNPNNLTPGQVLIIPPVEP